MTDHREASLSYTMTHILRRDPERLTYEPEPSTRCYSVREMQSGKRPEYICRRFPIPGGISCGEVFTRMLMENMTENTNFMQRLVERRMYP